MTQATELPRYGPTSNLPDSNSTFGGAAYLRDLFGSDPAAALARLADDVVWIVPGDPAFGGGTHKGREEVVQFFGSVLGLFPEGLAIEWLREWHGEAGCLVEAVLSGTTTAGHAYRNDYVFMLEVEAGQIQRVREYADTSYAEAVLNKQAN